MLRFLTVLENLAEALVHLLLEICVFCEVEEFGEKVFLEYIWSVGWFSREVGRKKEMIEVVFQLLVFPIIDSLNL